MSTSECVHAWSELAVIAISGKVDILPIISMTANWSGWTIEPLPVVYAYRDLGTVVDVQTRWSPRRIECTESADHANSPRSIYVVKFRRKEPVAQRAIAAAMCISELVSVSVMQYAGYRCLSPTFIYGSNDFADSCAMDAGFDYRVAEGYHYGTVFLQNVMPGPLPEFEKLAEPMDVVRLWALDCWLMNCDRDVYGYVLLEPAPRGKWNLVAADHSDCFMGAGEFCSGRCFDVESQVGAVNYSQYCERVILDQGTGVLRETIGTVVRCASELTSITERVPDQWWDEAGIDRNRVEGCLQGRAERMDTICDLDKWEGMRDAIQGGQQLGLL